MSEQLSMHEEVNLPEVHKPVPESNIDIDKMTEEYKRLHSEQYQKALEEVDAESSNEERVA